MKWLVLVFGAIGGVLLTGIQLSDLDQATGTDRALAIVGITAGFMGAGIALWFTVQVLLPIRLTLKDLKGDQRIGDLLVKEPDLLNGYGSIEALAEAKKAAILAEHDAWLTYKDGDGGKDQKDALDNASDIRKRPDEAVQRLMGFLLAERVRRRMARATIMIGVGALFVAGGIILFSAETNPSDAPKVGEVVPKRPSAVTVRLTAQGREDLAEALGRHCGGGHLRAIALGGPPNALELAAVPTARCNEVRFTLTPDVGAVTNEKRLRAIRACTDPGSKLPCIVYPNTPAAVFGTSP